jgi:GTP-binding protein
LHLIDATLDDVAGAYRVVRGEVEAYGAGLDEKPEIVALSKADAAPKAELKRKALALKKAAGRAPLIVSSATGEGVQEVLRALAAEAASVRAARAANETQGRAESSRGWRP